MVQVDLTFYFIYRILELGSRTTLLALFTVSKFPAALLPAKFLLSYIGAAAAQIATRSQAPALLGCVNVDSQ